MQLIGHGRATDDQGQGQHDLDLILLDAFDHTEGDVTDQATKQRAADGFAGEQDGGFGHRRGFTQLRNPQQHGEHHDRGAVVEQRFADNCGFQRFGGIGGTQGAEYRNGVGR
ncbi:hypothetical protein D3C77_625840 [compost metagenome]